MSQSDPRSYAMVSFESHAAWNEIERLLPTVRPQHRMRLARDILATLLQNDEVTYANFESAQAAKKYIKQAVKALNGLA